MSTSVTCIFITFVDRQKQGHEASKMSGRLQRFRLAQHKAAQAPRAALDLSLSCTEATGARMVRSRWRAQKGSDGDGKGWA
jgi:hypothetical protein